MTFKGGKGEGGGGREEGVCVIWIDQVVRCEICLSTAIIDGRGPLTSGLFRSTSSPDSHSS